MKKTRIKTYIIVAIFLSIIGISIAYAALSQQLQIKTTTTVQSSQTSWNIVFEKQGCHTSGHAKIGTIEVANTSVIISDFTLQAPGDGFSCWLYVENKGEVAAKITSINYTGPTFSGTGTSADADVRLVNDNFWHVISELAKEDILKPGDKKSFGIGFGIQEVMPTLPKNPVTFMNAVYTINFEQA